MPCIGSAYNTCFVAIQNTRNIAISQYACFEHTGSNTRGKYTHTKKSASTRCHVLTIREIISDQLHSLAHGYLQSSTHQFFRVFIECRVYECVRVATNRRCHRDVTTLKSKIITARVRVYPIRKFRLLYPCLYYIIISVN